MGLPGTATEADVRARYKELAMAAHPDRGGTAEEFQKITDWRDKALVEAQMGKTLANSRAAMSKLREAARGTKCPRCDGSGTRMTVQQGFREIKFPCTMCKGKGKLS